MVFFDGVGGLVFLGLWIFCIVDVITAPADRIRHLPRPVWLVLVILLVDLGSIAWLIAGHEWGARGQQPGESGAPAGRTPREPAAAAISPEDDEQFIAALRARADEQRRRARENRPPSDDPATDS